MFVRAAEKTASRAQLLYEYLADHDPRAVERRLAELQSADDPSKRALREAVEAQAAALRRGAGSSTASTRRWSGSPSSSATCGRAAVGVGGERGGRAAAAGGRGA